MSQQSLKECVWETLRTYEMTKPGEQVVCGVSGGADSVCLLLLLKELEQPLGIRVYAVHVQHGLRAGAEEDAVFTQELCRPLNIPVRIFHVDAAGEAQREGMSVEEAGRKLRYECFAAACREWDPGARWKIAVAHHREDCAETVLWNLCRGASLRGLAGIRPVNGNIIRPLIACSREQIEEELQSRRQPWRTDETNQDLSYTRNFLRGQILPELTKRVNAETIEHICRAAGDLAQAEEYLEEKTGEELQRCKDPVGEACYRVSALQKLEPYLRRRVLYEILRRVCGQKDLTSGHVAGAEHLLHAAGSADLDLPGGIRAKKVYDRLFFVTAGKQESAREKQSWEERIFPCPERREDYRVRRFPYSGNPDDIPADTYTKWLDYDRISSFLTFRARKEGDRLAIGIKSGEGELSANKAEAFCYKKLTRVMIDQRIPADLRDRMILPADGDRILWVPGYRIGADFRITDSTKTVLELSLSMCEGEKR